MIRLTTPGIDHLLTTNLLRATEALTESSLKLATLSRINRAADDPAGLIAAEEIRSELRAIEAELETNERSAVYARLADRQLDIAGQHLNRLRGAVVEASGDTLGDASKAASQIEVDAVLDAINRLGSSASFGGRRLLDGDFRLSAEVTLPKVSTTSLGGDAGSLAELASGGSANLIDGDPQKAIAIIDAARDQVLQARGQVGDFEKYTIDTTRELLGAQQVALSEGLSQIADTDVAKQAAALVRSEILVDTSILAIRSVSDRRRTVGLLLDAVR